MLTFKEYITEAVAKDSPHFEDSSNYYDGHVSGMPLSVFHYLEHLSGGMVDPKFHKSSTFTKSKIVKEDFDISDVLLEENKEKLKPAKIPTLHNHPVINAMESETESKLQGKNPIQHIMNGQHQAYTEMLHNTPEQQKEKEEAAHKHFQSFMNHHLGKGDGKERNFSFTGTNGKMIKSKDGVTSDLGKSKETGEEYTGVKTQGLALAPADSAGHKYDVCPTSSHSCEQGCLGHTVSLNAMTANKLIKAGRTHWMMQHPEHAAYLQTKELRQSSKKAKRMGLGHAYRSNVTSDIPTKMPEEYKNSDNLPEHVKHMGLDRTVRYNYSKSVNNALKAAKSAANREPHEDVTYSSTGPNVDINGHHNPESNDENAHKVIKAKGKVAMVVSKRGYSRLKGFKNMSTGEIIPHTAADNHDYRPIDHAEAGALDHEGNRTSGVVASLKMKGGNSANVDEKTGEVTPNRFVAHPNNAGYVEFNHPGGKPDADFDNRHSIAKEEHRRDIEDALRNMKIKKKNRAKNAAKEEAKQAAKKETTQEPVKKNPNVRFTRS